MTIVKNGSEPIIVHWRIDQWFPDLSAEVRAKLKAYHAELLKFNKTINLIGVKTIPFADALHFADCIMAVRVINQSTKLQEIHDFGSGNGFPGVVLAIMNPETKVHLVDIDQRKAEFLKHIISVLELKNADVLIRNIETLPEGSVKCAISRGYAPISKAILVARKLIPTGGSYFHMKSEEWATEIADIPTQLCSYWQPGLLAEYKLPVGEVKFAVVKTEKIGN